MGHMLSRISWNTTAHSACAFASRNCKTFGWPAVRKRTYMSYTMLQTASTVHTGPGAPTCHVRDVILTPNGIRFLSCRRTPGELGRTPTVCKHVGSIHSTAGLSGVLGHLPHPSLPLCASGCARFPFLVTRARSGDARYTTGYCPGGTMSTDTGPYLGLADMFSQCQSV